MGRSAQNQHDFPVERMDLGADDVATAASTTPPPPVTACAPAAVEPYYVVSHDVLFATPPERCHACDEDVSADDEPFEIVGRGLLLFSRGEERRAEEPKLCPSCGAAIGMTMLSRWAIEEEEG